MKKNIRKALASMLVFTMCFSSVNISAFAQNTGEIDPTTEVINEQMPDDNIEESTNIDEAIAESETVSETDVEPTNTSDNNGWDHITKEKIFEGENYKVYFVLSSNWDDGYNATIKLENLGNEPIQNWYLGFEYADSITNIWNAEILSNENGYYTIKNVGWNQDIASGSSIEFGISVNVEFTGFPEKYDLIGTCSKVIDDDYTVQYVVDNDWGTGFHGSISIRNNADNTLEDWILEFDFDREITEIWNGVIEQHTGNHYIIRNAEYNSNIASGISVSIGIKGNGGDSDEQPCNFLLYSYKNKEKYIDLDNDGIPDELEDLSMWSDMKDTDDDGLPDDVEKWLGSDENDIDTDQDGLSDYYEMFITYTDLLVADSDNNGIIDGNEDFDNDGLTNLEEAFISHPLYFDTDGDGISDYDERLVYNTNPNLKDTDLDGAEDKWEIDNKYEPTVYNDFFTLYKEITVEDITASVSLEVGGYAVDSLIVEPVENKILLDESIPGYIGKPFDFEIDGDFKSAIISFEFNENYLQDEDFVPTIYYFNENTQLLEELETKTDGNKASATTTHFSTYVLLNKTTYEKSWNEIKNTNGKLASEVNIGFVVDTSGSMSGTKISTAKRVIQNFINEIRTNSVKTKMSLVKFSSYATIVSPLTDDFDAFLSKLNNLGSSGLTSIYKGLEKSLYILVENKNNLQSYNAIILLTDGYDEPSTTYNLYSKYINTAINNDINIYTIGVGTIDENLLIKIADETGGKYYYAADSSNLYEIYEEIETEIIDYTTDSNADGISDYYSKLLCEGKLRIGTQGNLFEGISYEKFNANNDYDEDGIINGKEFELKVDPNTGCVYVYVWSNPFSKDTDNDGINDLLDDSPLDYEKGFTIYETENTDEELKALSHDNRPEDFQYADKSIDQLRDMKYINWTDFFGVETNDYVYSWKSLVKLTSTGDMQDVAIDMVNHFMDGTASDYWNATLTKNMEKHSSSEKYTSDITNIINSYIKENDGDISGLIYNTNNRDNLSLIKQMRANKVYAPVYKDKFSGLGICVDSLYGNKIEITSYKFDGTNYEYTLKFTLYDIYGLDSADIEEKKYVDNITGFGLLAGFRSWYILQHCNLYGGDYQPFITYASFEKTVKGNIK